jgi:hypothetical protein
MVYSAVLLPQWSGKRNKVPATKAPRYPSYPNNNNNNNNNNRTRKSAFIEGRYCGVLHRQRTFETRRQ